MTSQHTSATVWCVCVFKLYFSRYFDRLFITCIAIRQNKQKGSYHTVTISSWIDKITRSSHDPLPDISSGRFKLQTPVFSFFCLRLCHQLAHTTDSVSSSHPASSSERTLDTFTSFYPTNMFVLDRGLPSSDVWWWLSTSLMLPKNCRDHSSLCRFSPDTWALSWNSCRWWTGPTQTWSSDPTCQCYKETHLLFLLFQGISRCTAHLLHLPLLHPPELTAHSPVQFPCFHVWVLNTFLPDSRTRLL